MKISRLYAETAVTLPVFWAGWKLLDWVWSFT